MPTLPLPHLLQQDYDATHFINQSHYNVPGVVRYYDVTKSRSWPHISENIILSPCEFVYELHTVLLDATSVKVKVTIVLLIEVMHPLSSSSSSDNKLANVASSPGIMPAEKQGSRCSLELYLFILVYKKGSKC